MSKENVLYINGKDVWTTWGAFLIEDSYNNLMQPADLKPYVENDFRSQAGKRVLITNSQPTDRNIQLVFDIVGESILDFNKRKDDLLSEMTGKLFELKVIPLMTAYKVYLPPNYFLALSADPSLSSGKLSVRLNEPDPTDRKVGNSILEWVFKDGAWQRGYWLKGEFWGADRK